MGLTVTAYAFYGVAYKFVAACGWLSTFQLRLRLMVAYDGGFGIYLNALLVVRTHPSNHGHILASRSRVVQADHHPALSYLSISKPASSSSASDFTVLTMIV